MELLYVHYNRNGSSTFYFLPIGERQGRLAGLASDDLTDPEIRVLRTNADALDKMSGEERYHWLVETIPSFRGAYKELVLKHIVEAFRYKVKPL